MRARNLDVLKWLGAAAMVADHVGLYVVGPSVWSEAVGALAFPLFAVALAEGTAGQHVASRVRTLHRLCLGALAAQFALLTVRDFAPLNVIFTLAAGVAIDTAVRYDMPTARRVALLVAAVAVCFWAEYLHVGAAFVAVLCWRSRVRSDVALYVAVALLVLVAPLNGNWWAIAALPLVALVSLLPRDTPRLRDAFYYVYVLQWPLLAALQLMQTAWGRS